MIKANELRIGNIVEFLYGEEDSMGNMIGQSDTKTILSGEDIQHVADFPDSYDPIPLTPEILGKCGFVPDCENFYLQLNEPYQSVIFLTGQFPKLVLEIDTCRMPLHKIKYLFQLQNLFFALTGDELEIKQQAIS